MAKFQNRIYGWKTWVVTRKEYDPYGLTVYGEACNCGVFLFYIKVLIESRSYNVLHIHSQDNFITLFDLIRKVRDHKCIIIHYHGSDIRGKWIQRKSKWIKSDLVIVATKDLYDEAKREDITSYKMIKYLPNPVDTDLFKPMPKYRRKNKALFLYSRRNPKLKNSLSWARKIADEYGLSLEIIDIDRNPIRYIDMPKLLNRYEYFIDHNYVPALSKTALEALACGVKVIRWDGKIIEKLPEEHKPENIVKTLKELYDETCIFDKF